MRWSSTCRDTVPARPCATGTESGHLRRAGRPGVRRGRRLAGDPPAGAPRAGQRRRRGRGLPRRAGRRATPCCSCSAASREAMRWRRTTPTWSPAVAGTAERAPRGHRPRPAPRPGAAAVARRARPARPSWSGSPHENVRGQRRARSRTTSSIRARRRRGDHAAAALLLRPVGAQQPPARAAPRCCSPTCRWSTRASGTLVRAPPGHDASPACRTPSTCSTGSASPSMDLPSLRYVTQAGGRLAPGAGARATPSSGASGAGTCS